MLSVLDPVHGPIGGFVDEFGSGERWSQGGGFHGASGGGGGGGSHRHRKRQYPRPSLPPPQPQLQSSSLTPRKSAKVSQPPRAEVCGRRLDNIVEFSACSPAWKAELELASQRADALRGSVQLIEADAAALERNQLAHRRLHTELIAIFDAIFAEADAVFERHRQRLDDEAAELKRRSDQLEKQLSVLTSAAGDGDGDGGHLEDVHCSDTQPGLVDSWEDLRSILALDAVPRCQAASCRGGAFGEDFQQAVKARLSQRSSDVTEILRDFRRQQQSSACRVFPCVLNLLAEVRTEMLVGPPDEDGPLQQQQQQQPVPPAQTQTNLASSNVTKRLDTGGVKLADLAIVRPSQALFYKPKFGVKRQRGWFGWSALPETVLYGVAPSDSGPQLLVLSRSGQHLTSMRLTFEANQSAGPQASRFEALHFSRRAQLLFLSDTPNNRVLAVDLCGACRLQLTGLNQPRGVHHDDLNERLLVINSGTATLEVFTCPIYPQQQQQLERLDRCIQHPGLLRISAVTTSLRCVYVTDSQLGRVFVFANQLPGFALLRTVDLLAQNPPAAAPPSAGPLFAHFALAALHDSGAEPELRTAELAVACPGASASALLRRPLYCANEAGCAFDADELTVYFCHSGEASVVAVPLS